MTVPPVESNNDNRTTNTVTASHDSSAVQRSLDKSTTTTTTTNDAATTASDAVTAVTDDAVVGTTPSVPPTVPQATVLPAAAAAAAAAAAKNKNDKKRRSPAGGFFLSGKSKGRPKSSASNGAVRLKSAKSSPNIAGKNKKQSNNNNNNKRNPGLWAAWASRRRVASKQKKQQKPRVPTGKVETPGVGVPTSQVLDEQGHDHNAVIANVGKDLVNQEKPGSGEMGIVQDGAAKMQTDADTHEEAKEEIMPPNEEEEEQVLGADYKLQAVAADDKTGVSEKTRNVEKDNTDSLAALDTKEGLGKGDTLVDAQDTIRDIAGTDEPDNSDPSRNVRTDNKGADEGKGDTIQSSNNDVKEALPVTANDQGDEKQIENEGDEGQGEQQTTRAFEDDEESIEPFPHYKLGSGYDTDKEEEENENEKENDDKKDDNKDETQENDKEDTKSNNADEQKEDDKEKEQQTEIPKDEPKEVNNETNDKEPKEGSEPTDESKQTNDNEPKEDNKPTEENDKPKEDSQPTEDDKPTDENDKPTDNKPTDTNNKPTEQKEENNKTNDEPKETTVDETKTEPTPTIHNDDDNDNNTFDDDNTYDDDATLESQPPAFTPRRMSWLTIDDLTQDPKDEQNNQSDCGSVGVHSTKSDDPSAVLRSILPKEEKPPTKSKGNSNHEKKTTKRKKKSTSRMPKRATSVPDFAGLRRNGGLTPEPPAAAAAGTTKKKRSGKNKKSKDKTSVALTDGEGSPVRGDASTLETSNRTSGTPDKPKKTTRKKKKKKPTTTATGTDTIEVSRKSKRKEKGETKHGKEKTGKEKSKSKGKTKSSTTAEKKPEEKVNEPVIDSGSLSEKADDDNFEAKVIDMLYGKTYQKEEKTEEPQPVDDPIEDNIESGQDDNAKSNVVVSVDSTDRDLPITTTAAAAAVPPPEAAAVLSETESNPDILQQSGTTDLNADAVAEVATLDGSRTVLSNTTAPTVTSAGPLSAPQPPPTDIQVDLEQDNENEKDPDQQQEPDPVENVEEINNVPETTTTTTTTAAATVVDAPTPTTPVVMERAAPSSPSRFASMSTEEIVAHSSAVLRLFLMSKGHLHTASATAKEFEQYFLRLEQGQKKQKEKKKKDKKKETENQQQLMVETETTDSTVKEIPGHNKNNNKDNDDVVARETTGPSKVASRGIELENDAGSHTNPDPTTSDEEDDMESDRSSSMLGALPPGLQRARSEKLQESVPQRRATPGISSTTQPLAPPQDPSLLGIQQEIESTLASLSGGGGGGFLGDSEKGLLDGSNDMLLSDDPKSLSLGNDNDNNKAEKGGQPASTFDDIGVEFSPVNFNTAPRAKKLSLKQEVKDEMGPPEAFLQDGPTTTTSMKRIDTYGPDLSWDHQDTTMDWSKVQRDSSPADQAGGSVQNAALSLLRQPSSGSASTSHASLDSAGKRQGRFQPDGSWAEYPSTTSTASAPAALATSTSKDEFVQVVRNEQFLKLRRRATIEASPPRPASVPPSSEVGRSVSMGSGRRHSGGSHGSGTRRHKGGFYPQTEKHGKANYVWPKPTLKELQKQQQQLEKVGQTQEEGNTEEQTEVEAHPGPQTQASVKERARRIEHSRSASQRKLNQPLHPANMFLSQRGVVLPTSEGSNDSGDSTVVPPTKPVRTNWAASSFH